jgi:hypothetical protein
MSIGFGIGLLLIGLILVLRVVQVDLPYVDDYRLGVLLVILGIVAVLLTLLAWNRTTRSHVIEERRINDPRLP